MTTDSQVNRGVIMGLMLKAYRAQDFRMTVLTEPTKVTESFLRLRVSVPGMLSTVGWTPAMYLRVWFERNGRAHQRAYTVIEPDVEADEFTIAVALHDGTAANWFAAAQPGDEREVTLLGRGFQQTPLPHQRYLAVADMASLPALGDVLAALDDRPCDIVLETHADADNEVPVPARPQDNLTVVRRRDGDAASSAVLEAVAALDLSQHALWAAADARTTRAVVQHCKSAGIPRKAMDTLAYWDPKGMTAPS